MNSDVDASILNSVTVKRFTKAVLEEYDAEIDRSNSAEWQVAFPEKIANRLDRGHGTLVFDAADRELGSGALLVEPGTQVFSALLDSVQDSSSVGRLHLTEDDLQVTPPTVLQESALELSVAEFTKRTSDFALTFHFRVEFETPASFHNEEMFSVTIDPGTNSRLPELSARLTSHLPQLIQESQEGPEQDIPAGTVEEAFEEAQQAVLDRARPVIEDIREDADASASDRIEEISDWYDQRRAELDEKIAAQEEEVKKWRKKRRKARKDETRRRYIQNRKEAEAELAELQEEVEDQKEELDQEETEEIDQVIDRNEVDVTVSLLGVTEVTYVRGTLALEVTSGHAEADIEVSYLPATDEFRGLDCEVCSQDLTDGILPKLCANGHLVGDPCVTSCRECGLAYCDDCDTASEFVSCAVCWEDVCQDCSARCEECSSHVCPDHSVDCTECESPVCLLCGEDCSTCGDFRCDSHSEHCPDCTEERHCQTHLTGCSVCDEQRCEEHIGQCSVCDELVCSEHSSTCDTCGDVICRDHVDFCGPCSDQSDDTGFCPDHKIRCDTGDRLLCKDHRIATTVGEGYICSQHRAPCSTCKVYYSEAALTDGQCSACRAIGEVPDDQIPQYLHEEFRSVYAGANEAFMIILGKKLIGRNKLIPLNRETGEEEHRQAAGMVDQLRGKYR